MNRWKSTPPTKLHLHKRLGKELFGDLPGLEEGTLAISREHGFLVTAMSTESQKLLSFSEGTASRGAEGIVSNA